MMKIYKKNEIEAYLKNRKTNLINRKVDEAVAKIIDDVRISGDDAVKRYTKQFDKIDLDKFNVGNDAINNVQCDGELIKVMERAAKNIYDFHINQKKQSFIDAKQGIILGQKITPLEKAALYVPGGSANYPSSVLMNAIPAKIAGVKEIIILTPPKQKLNPAVAAAAKIAGVTDIYTIGGAQAVAAAAFGTESIPKVDKIVGPGNIYVTAAKRMVYGIVDIDMIAGPSEILIIADDTANPRCIAADLFSQAEHDSMAKSTLVTTSESLAAAVISEAERQIQILSRRDIIEQSVKNNGAILIVDSIKEAIELSDRIAPEHLELAVRDPMTYLGEIKNAGSIFLGEYSPEPLGDYYAGTNHVLPTDGAARFSSPLDVDAFVKKSSFIYCSKEKLTEYGGDIIRFANAENLDAHANSIKVRLENE